MKIAALSEITATLESGARPAAGVTDEREIPSLGGEHIAPDGSIREEKLRFITKDTYASLRSGKLKSGDVLIVKDGATTGKTAFYTHLNGFGEAALNEHVFLLRTDADRADSKYVYWFLRSERGRAEILKDFRGATVGGISRGFIDKVRVPLPPLAEQKRIAGILDTADALRVKRRDALAQLDILLQATFLHLFGDPVTNPKGFKVVRLADVATRITDGIHQKPNYTGSGVPFISVKDITTGNLKFDDCKFISAADHNRFTKRCKPERLDILYTKVGATYGRPAIVDTGREFSIYVSVCLIKPRKEVIDPYFLTAVMATSAVKNQADRRIKGIGVPDLHLDQIQSFLIPLPSMSQQHEFARRINAVEKLKSAHRAHLAELDTLFASLQSRAFRGEL